MRITPQRDGVRGTHTLPYHKLRPDLLRPSGQLALSDFRIKIVSPDDDLEIRSQIILQNGRDAAVTAPAHSVDIKYNVFSHPLFFGDQVAHRQIDKYVPQETGQEYERPVGTFDKRDDDRQSNDDQKGDPLRHLQFRGFLSATELH